MDLRQLEHFVAIAECGQIGLAADGLGLTQQALSKSLARLESQLGGKLFERTPKGVVCTPLGDAIRSHAAAVLAEAAELAREAANLTGLGRGRLVVGLSPLAALSWPGAVVRRVAEQFGTLELDILDGTTDFFAAALARGEMDLAISGQLSEADSQLMSDPLCHERYCVVGREEHPLLDAASRLEDLGSATWFLGRDLPVFQDSVYADFVDAGLPVGRQRMESSSLYFILSALRTGDRLSILPDVLQSQTVGLQFRHFPGCDWTSPLYLIRRRRAVVEGALATLIETLRREATVAMPFRV